LVNSINITKSKTVQLISGLSWTYNINSGNINIGYSIKPKFGQKAQPIRQYKVKVVYYNNDSNVINNNINNYETIIKTFTLSGYGNHHNDYHFHTYINKHINKHTDSSLSTTVKIYVDIIYC